MIDQWFSCKAEGFGVPCKKLETSFHPERGRQIPSVFDLRPKGLFFPLRIALQLLIIGERFLRHFNRQAMPVKGTRSGARWASGETVCFGGI